MKKIAYQAPEMESVKIEYSKMLCGSPDGSGSTSDANDPVQAEPGDY